MCPNCKSKLLSTAVSTEFTHSGKAISYEYTLLACSRCKYRDDSDRLKVYSEEVNRLGFLSPIEIIETRSLLENSRLAFVKATGISEASFLRWEKGDLLQSRMADNYIYLLRIGDNYKTIKGRTS